MNGLVGDRCGAGVEYRPGARWVRRQVEVGEENLVPAQPVVLRRDGFFDLQQQVRLGPDIISLIDDGGANRPVVIVGERRTDPGAGLDQYLVTMPDCLIHSRRRDRHPVLMILDLLGNTDPHGCTPCLGVTG